MAKAFIGLICCLLVVLCVLSVDTPMQEQPRQPPTTTERSTVLENTYNPDAFYREDGFLRYRDATHLVGMDVSEHQSVIDWQEVADSGVEFVIIRAGFRGSSKGALYEDAQFRYNLRGAKEAGLQVGVYFFSQALGPVEAEEEAAYVCELLDGEGLDLPIFFDWEYIGGRVESIEAVPLTFCARRFCQIVEERGYQAGVYFNQTFGSHYFDLWELREYTLWLAEYNPVPGFPYGFDCLQYTDNGTVAGIEGAVDLDILWLPQ